MKEFRSLEEVDRAGLGACAYRAVHGTLKRLIDAYGACGEEYVPEDDGHVVLLEPGDTDDDVRAAIGYALRDAPFEGCVYEDGFFLTCVLFNNQYGISIVIPDAPWLDPAVRAAGGGRRTALPNPGVGRMVRCIRLRTRSRAG